MGVYIDTFRRVEAKYLLDTEQFEGLSRLLDGKMEIDRYGKSTICNIYYDTPDYALARASIEKPVFKEKLRIRSYGVPDADGVVFAELKRKYKGVVYKRRVSMRCREAETYFAGGDAPAGALAENPQIIGELDWFRSLYRPIPAAAVMYDRVALYGDDPNFRLTLDENLRWRSDRLRLTDGDDGALLAPRESRLMEVKTTGSMPLWFAEGLDRLAIRPASFSKYGEVYRQYLYPAASARWQAKAAPAPVVESVPASESVPVRARGVVPLRHGAL